MTLELGWVMSNLTFLWQFYYLDLLSVYSPLSSSSSVVELSVDTFGSFEESFFDFAIDFARKIFH